MTTSFHRETAKIYEFPVGGRAALSKHRDGAKPAADVATVRAPRIAFGTGWYHDVAVQEAEQARKR